MADSPKASDADPINKKVHTNNNFAHLLNITPSLRVLMCCKVEIKLFLYFVKKNNQHIRYVMLII